MGFQNIKREPSLIVGKGIKKDKHVNVMQSKCFL